MKRISILFAVIIFSMVSCSEDFLDKKPTTSSVVENFYKTPGDAKQALTTVYSMLMYDDYWSSFIISEIASDNCAGGGGLTDGDGYQRYDKGFSQTANNVNIEAWNYYFGLIYRANTYIVNEKLIDWTGKDNLQKQYLAEARYLRAYAHFYLARLFGEIPALTELFSPDIVKPFIDKEIPGIMELIRFKYGSLKPNALLSRAIAGVMRSTLIYTLPGSVKAVDEYMTEITPTLRHSIYMLHNLDAH